MRKRLVIVTLLLLFCACARDARRPSESSSTTGTPSPTPTRRPVPTPPPVAADARRERGSGVFDKYSFTYEKTGEQTVAEFAAPKLPYDDRVVIGAGREVILAAYGERMQNFPRRVAWRYGDSEHAIKLAGNEYDYVFVHLADANKEIPRLVFWRVTKGTVE